MKTVIIRLTNDQIQRRANQFARALDAADVPKHSRQMQVLLDLSILTGSLVLANLLRFDFQIPENHLAYLVVQLPLVVGIQYASLLATGVYRFVWRYIGMAELRAFLTAAVYATVPILILRLALPDGLQAWRVPRGVILMDVVLAFGGVVAIRVLRRSLYERYEKGRGQASGVTKGGDRVLLIGGLMCGFSRNRKFPVGSCSSSQGSERIAASCESMVRTR